MTYKRAHECDVTVEVTRREIDRGLALARASDDLARGKERALGAGGTRALLAVMLTRVARNLLAAEMRAYSVTVRRNATGETRMSSFLRLFKFAAAFVLLTVPLAALAQAGSLPTELPLDEALKQLVPIIGSLKGASALGIALAVTQVVMLAARTPLANFAGKWKLLVVAVLSLVTTYIGLVLAGASWSAALLMGPVMTALQVLANQVWKQVKPEADPGA